MSDVRVDQSLWENSIYPRGIVERWLVRDGETVAAGACIAEILVGDHRHEVSAPCSGRLSIIAARDAMIRPGSILATVLWHGLAARPSHTSAMTRHAPRGHGEGSHDVFAFRRSAHA